MIKELKYQPRNTELVTTLSVAFNKYHYVTRKYGIRVNRLLIFEDCFGKRRYYYSPLSLSKGFYLKTTPSKEATRCIVL